MDMDEGVLHMVCTVTYLSLHVYNHFAVELDVRI